MKPIGLTAKIFRFVPTCDEQIRLQSKKKLSPKKQNKNQGSGQVEAGALDAFISNARLQVHPAF